MQAIQNCISAAGYDVGEYAALVFAGAMSFEDGMFVIFQLVEARCVFRTHNW